MDQSLRDTLAYKCGERVFTMLRRADQVIQGMGMAKEEWTCEVYEKGLQLTFCYDQKWPDEDENVSVWINFEGKMAVSLWWLSDGNAWDYDTSEAAVAKAKELLKEVRKRKELTRKRKEVESDETPVAKSPKIEEEKTCWLMFKLADQVGQGMLLKDSAWSCKPHEKGLELKFYHDPDYPQDGDNIVGVWVNFEGQMAVDFWPQGHGDKWSYSDWEEVVAKAKRLLLKIKHRKRREAEGIEEDSDSV